MKQYKKLLEDSFIFAIGNLGSKLITFLMLPLYTYTLTTSEYGTVDLLLTTTSLLLPIIGLSVFDAVLRFSMDKKLDSSSILSNGIYVTSLASGVLILLIIPFIYFNNNLAFLAILLIIQLFQNLFSQFAKAINELKVFAFNGILLSFVTAGLNILFLVTLKMGLSGYLYSILLANLVSTIYLGSRLKIAKIYDKKKISKKEIFMLLKFSVPLIPNSIAWWATSAIGRYFVLIWLGTAANGIFAVSNKIPTLLTVFTSIFAQSWQISAIEGYEGEDNKGFLDSVYSFYTFLLFIGSSILIIFIKPIIIVLVSSEFFESWRYVPFLLLTVIFSSISGFLGSQYIAMKDSTGVFKTTVIGSAANILLNFLLVPYIGIQGVGIASFLSFFGVWIIRHKKISRIYNLKFSTTSILLSTAIITVQCIISVNIKSNLNYIYQMITLLLLFIVYRKITVKLTLKIKRFIVKIV